MAGTNVNVVRGSCKTTAKLLHKAEIGSINVDFEVGYDEHEDRLVLDINSRTFTKEFLKLVLANKAQLNLQLLIGEEAVEEKESDVRE